MIIMKIIVTILFLGIAIYAGTKLMPISAEICGNRIVHASQIADEITRLTKLGCTDIRTVRAEEEHWLVYGVEITNRY